LEFEPSRCEIRATAHTLDFSSLSRARVGEFVELARSIEAPGPAASRAAGTPLASPEGMASEQLHEPAESLRPGTIELHRAIVSLMEELEAVDWYSQRVDATRDEALRAVLAHNRDEEKEHACMTLEWIRRNDAGFDRLLRAILFRSGPIEAEVEETQEGNGKATRDGSLGVGGLREEAAT
jgi:ferritin-like protein